MPAHFTFRFPLLLLIFFIISENLHGQSTLTVHVTDVRKDPLPDATVAIQNRADSTAQFRRTDSTGIARFRNLQKGQYTITVTSVGFPRGRQNLTLAGDDHSINISLQGGTQTLGGVVVEARKPIMRQEDDKTIVDPENLAAASTNGYEILEKTPGLFVDQDGNIYLSSTTPATVYINGREQKMSAADIATLLKSLPPGAIARIEIMRTPSARYDASGGGGIVNVILKKGVRIGLTGSAQAGFNQGRYGNRFAGINLSNNSGKWNTYLNAQAATRNSYEQLVTKRLFTPDSLLSQDALTKYPGHNFFTGFGATYLASDKWEFGYDGRVNIGRSGNNSTNRTRISQVSTGNIATDNLARVNNKGENFNLNQSFNAKFKIDTMGSEWNTDVSFTYAPNQTGQVFQTEFFASSISPRTGTGAIENDLQFLSAQSNLLRKLPKKLTIETGLKTTLVSFHNSTTYNIRSAYRYRENINAAFVQASKSFSGFILKAGTRVENTNMRGHQLQPVDTSFLFQSTNLFPYIYLSRPIMKIAGFELRAYLVYRRTISRPAYEYLNPYPRIVDPYLSERGNPGLRPQFTQNYEANISVDERPVFAVGINDTKDIFTQVVYQSDSSNKSIAFRTYDNLGKNKEFYFRALGAIPPGKRYFIVAGAQYNHNFYQGFYEGKPLAFKRGSWTIFSYQTFRITPLLQATLNGFARFRGQMQFYELSSFGALNFSLSQQLLQKKLTVSAFMQDILFTNNNEFTLLQGTVNASGMRESDTRRFGVNLRYNFGFRKKNEEQNMFNADAVAEPRN